MSSKKELSPGKAVKWNSHEAAMWTKLRDDELFRMQLVHSYESGKAGSKEIWTKVYLDFLDGPQLVLNMDKVKTWFHNVKGMKKDSVLSKLKARMEAEGFDANKNAAELQALYHNRPISVSWRNAHAHGSESSDDFESPPTTPPQRKSVPNPTWRRGAARMNASNGGGAAAGAGAGAADGGTPPKRVNSLEYPGADESPVAELTRSPTVVTAGAGSGVESALLGIQGALHEQTTTLSMIGQLMATKLQHLIVAAYAAGKTADPTFAAKQISNKKAEKKAVSAKERAATAARAPEGLDGTLDIVGDDVKGARSAQNAEAMRVLAQRLSSKDPEEKKKRKIDGAANAANPSDRDAKRLRAANGAGAATGAARDEKKNGEAAAAAAPVAAAAAAAASSSAAAPAASVSAAAKPAAAAAAAAADRVDVTGDSDEAAAGDD